MMLDGIQEVFLCFLFYYLFQILIDGMDVKIVKSVKDCVLGIL